MPIFKRIENNQLYLYMNGSLIYKRWLDTGQSLIFDIRPYDKNTLVSIHDKNLSNDTSLIKASPVNTEKR